MIDLRKWWERWGPVATALVALLGAVVGATYYLSRKIVALETVESAVNELKTAVLQTAESSASLAKELRGRQDQEARQFSDRMRDLELRLVRLEVSVKLAGLLASGNFEGAMLKTPKGTTFYGPRDVPKFRKDADKAIGSGGGFSVEEAAFNPRTGECVRAPMPDCIVVGFFDANLGDNFAYQLQARVLSPERLAARWVPGAFYPCKPLSRDRITRASTSRPASPSAR